MEVTVKDQKREFTLMAGDDDNAIGIDQDGNPVSKVSAQYGQWKGKIESQGLQASGFWERSHCDQTQTYSLDLDAQNSKSAIKYGASSEMDDGSSVSSEIGLEARPKVPDWTPVEAPEPVYASYPAVAFPALQEQWEKISIPEPEPVPVSAGEGALSAVLIIGLIVLLPVGL